MESPSKSFEKSAVLPPRFVDLPRALGFWGGAAIMVGIMIGGGIFRTPTTIAQHLGNPWIVLLLWLIGGVVALCGALTYAELATMFPQSGGIYVFLKEGYGRCMAFVFGWTYLLVSKPLAAGGIAIVFAEYFNPLFGVQWDPAYITCVVLLALTIINTFHISVGAGFATFLTGLKVTALIGIIALAVLLQKGDAAHILVAPDPDPDLFAALAVVMAAIMWTYDGWSDIGAVAGEVRDPQRRIPRIFVVGTLGVTLLYIGVNAAYLWMMPLAEMAGTDTVATIVIGRIVGEVGATVTAIVVLISTLGSTHGSIITGARVSYAQARDGLLFEFLGRVHPRFHTPAISLWFQLILSCVATLYYQKFGTLIAGFIFTMWIFYGLAGIALIILRIRRPDAPRAFRVPLFPIIPIVFILSSIAMTILQAREQELADTLVWTGILIAGVPAYFLWTALAGRRDAR